MQETDTTADLAHNAADVDTGRAETTLTAKGPAAPEAAASDPVQGNERNSPNGVSQKEKNVENNGLKDRAGVEAERTQHAATATHGHDANGSNKRIGDPAKTPQRREISTAVPYPSRHQRPNMLTGAASYWQAAERDRTIGVGTVGLFENRQDDKPPPDGASARINGTLVVGPLGYVRKMNDYINWREKHSHLFSALRVQDPKERVLARQRQLHAKARQQEEAEGEYASAVKRLRQRGWSVLGSAPRRVDNARLKRIRSEREAFRIECEESTLRKLREASKQREIISEQLAMSKEERLRQENLVRDASRLEREMQSTRREEHSAHIKEQASKTRAEREAKRECFREYAAMEDSYRQNQLSALRERVLAKAYTNGFASTFSSDVRGAGIEYPPGDWRSTFQSPLRRLPNASDDDFRRQWMAELQQERRALARAEVEMERAKRLQVSARREFAYRGNCERAGVIRRERETLRERKQQLDEEVERLHKALRQQEAEGQKRREDAIHSLRELRRLHASRLRQAIEEEELLAQTAEGADLQRLRERAAQMRMGMSPSPLRAQRPPPPPLEGEFLDG
ncbi:uncharacterized protein Tco025E_00294 [Trypanosoma conorhini]|uniref:Uncharacterized protein n=1 Tax=Trypanosoma conorhini TaxID=83891 RepID=A0A3R7P1S4_9TRYP|nr:uncharacterized protein Tco025E_00294 [Trypanosoma conorhini]RNF27492.1 hypothetical protein Tco025E_00294 [Trypanosoma conorhini]